MTTTATRDIIQQAKAIVRQYQRGMRDSGQDATVDWDVIADSVSEAKAAYFDKYPDLYGTEDPQEIDVTMCWECGVDTKFIV
jgi:hypothetical protein